MRAPSSLDGLETDDVETDLGEPTPLFTIEYEYDYLKVDGPMAMDTFSIMIMNMIRYNRIPSNLPIKIAKL